jgi:threonine dehydrogenase-like Zn-dependent dehydrogenase
MYGGIPGGQAELVRVPKANTGPFKVPGTLADEKVLFLSDILPTAWQAVINSGVGQGSSLAIYGAGPVGLLSAACARMLGVERIFMVDHHAYRLAYAQRTYGVIPINFDEDDDPADTIISQTPGSRGVDGVIDAVGFEAKGSTTETVLATLKIEGSSGKALRQCIAAVRRGGSVSVPGVYAGFIHGFLFGDAFDKGLTFKMGQTHVQRYLLELLGHIETGRLQPDAIISHRLSLEQAAEGYKIFDKKQEDCRKVILTPGGSDVPLAEVDGTAPLVPAV